MRRANKCFLLQTSQAKVNIDGLHVYDEKDGHGVADSSAPGLTRSTIRAEINTQITNITDFY